MPTCDDLATKAELAQLKDKINKILGAKGGGAYDNVIDDPSALLSLAPVAAVGGGLWLNKAFNSMYKIELTSAGQGAIWKELAEGSAQLTGFKGNGTSARIAGLEKVGAVAGQGVKVANTATVAASHTAAAVNLLATLVTIAGTLALNKATVDIFDQRIEAEAKAATDAINQVQNTTLRLYQQHQGDIDAINADIGLNNDRIAAQNVITSGIRNELEEQRINFEYLGYQMQYAQDSIDQLTLENDRLFQELTVFQASSEAQIGEINDLVTSLQNSLSSVSTQLYQAQTILLEQQSEIARIDSVLTDQGDKIDSLQSELTEQGEEIAALQVAFAQLRADLGLPEAPNPNPKDYALIQIFRHEKNYADGTGGGGGAAIAGNIGAQNQNAILKIANRFTEPPLVLSPITPELVLNNTSPFTEVLDLLLPNISNAVKPEDLEEIITQVQETMEITLAQKLGDGIVGKIDDLLQRTTDEKLADTVETTICKSLNSPKNCEPVPGTPKNRKGLQGLGDDLDDILSLLSLLSSGTVPDPVDLTPVLDEIAIVKDAVLAPVQATVDIGECTPATSQTNAPGYSYLTSSQHLVNEPGVLGLAAYCKGLDLKLTALHKDLCKETPVDDELLNQILDYTSTIYKILGGGVWTEAGEAETKTVSLAVNPEAKIKQFGAQLYTQDSSQLNELTATNLLDLVNINETVNYYRNGFHRLPATTLKSLINSEQNANEQITIYDAFSWQEYLIKQVDALVGEFPIKIKHQSLDSSGEEVEQDVVIDNISVAIAEILALNLGITHDADTSINIGMKTLIEARNAANAAIVGIDYAKANAEYLGYKGNQKTREVDCTFTPKAKDLRKALKPSNQKIVGWENEDKETLIELIKKTLVGTEIIKAALFHPYESGGGVTGDSIKNSSTDKETQDNTEWEEFKQRINNPSGRYQVPKPQANIRDLTIDEPTP